MHAAAAQTAFHRRDRVANFGRTEIIDGSEYTSLVEVDLTEQQSWTLVIDTKQLSFATGSPGTFASKVQARIEVGSGNGLSVMVVDATDLLLLPVAGDHLKVAVTLVSALNLVAPGGEALGFGVPAAAPKGDQALVSAYLSSSESTVQPPAGVAASVAPFVGSVAAPTNFAPAGVASAVPCRLRSFSAFNPSESTTFLALKSSNSTTETLSEPQSIATTLLVVPLPAGQLVQFPIVGTMAFARGLVWMATTDPQGQNPSATSIRFDCQLLRAPSANGDGAPQGVSSITPIT